MNEKKTMTVKDWADEDKPRERLLSQGKKQLSDAELLAILMRTGVHGKSVVELAKEILASTGNSLVALSRLDYSQLRTFKGMAGAYAAMFTPYDAKGRVNPEMIERIIQVEDSVDECKDEYKASHIARMNAGECNADTGTMFLKWSWNATPRPAILL